MDRHETNPKQKQPTKNKLEKHTLVPPQQKQPTKIKKTRKNTPSVRWKSTHEPPRYIGGNGCWYPISFWWEDPTILFPSRVRRFWPIKRRFIVGHCFIIAFIGRRTRTHPFWGSIVAAAIVNKTSTSTSRSSDPVRSIVIITGESCAIIASAIHISLVLYFPKNNVETGWRMHSDRRKVGSGWPNTKPNPKPVHRQMVSNERFSHVTNPKTSIIVIIMIQGQTTVRKQTVCKLIPHTG